MWQRGSRTRQSASNQLPPTPPSKHQIQSSQLIVPPQGFCFSQCLGKERANLASRQNASSPLRPYHQHFTTMDSKPSLCRMFVLLHIYLTTAFMVSPNIAVSKEDQQKGTNSHDAKSLNHHKPPERPPDLANTSL